MTNTKHQSTKPKPSQTNIKSSKAKALKILKQIILLILFVVISFPSIFWLKNFVEEKQTMQELYEPILAEDVAGMKLKERYIYPAHKFIKESYGSISSDYQRADGKTDEQTMAELKTIALDNGWEEFNSGKDDGYLYFSGRKERLSLLVFFEKDYVSIRIKKMSR